MQRLKVTYRIAMILVALSVGPLFLAGATGVLPIGDGEVMALRQSESQLLASQFWKFYESGNQEGLEVHLSQTLGRPSGMRSIRVIRFDGRVLYESPHHEKFWTLKEGEPSNIDMMWLPLQRDNRHWANMEIIYDSSAWWSHGTGRFLVWIGAAVVLNTLTFLAFLNRVLAVLDPQSAVPKRVRNTLDTIAGGVVVLDTNGKIMLVNESFAKSSRRSQEELVGTELSNMNWRLGEMEDVPWIQVLAESIQVSGVKILLPGEDGFERCFVVNATPIRDSRERLAGCLVSFEDVTNMEVQRRNLLKTMEELEQSRELIRGQNEALQVLASRDALTGALNRRAFFEKAL